MPLVCPKCGKEFENRDGLCPTCPRVPNQARKTLLSFAVIGWLGVLIVILALKYYRPPPPVGSLTTSPHSQRVNPQLPLELVLQPDKITLGRLTFPRMHEGYPICLHGTATPARIADCVPDSVGAALRERLATETLLSIACFPPVAPDALRSVIALGKPAGIPTTVANDCAPYLKAQGAVTEDANLPLWPVRADSASATKIEFEREYDLFAIEIASGAGHVSQVRVETEGGASTILDFDPDAPGFSRRPLVGMRGRTLTVNASAGRLAIAEIRVFGR